MAARAEEIEAGHGRTASDLLIDVRDSADRFAAAYAAMPDQAWARLLRWASGKERSAARGQLCSPGCSVGPTARISAIHSPLCRSSADGGPSHPSGPARP
jgi:hypothetical protein